MNIEIREDYRTHKVPAFEAGDILIIEPTVSDRELLYYFAYKDKGSLFHLINLETGKGVWADPMQYAELVAHLQNSSVIKSINACKSKNIHLSLKI